MTSQVMAVSYLIGLVILVATGCATAPIPPTYTAAELQPKCIRTGGWWRVNILDGYCEYELPMP